MDLSLKNGSHIEKQDMVHDLEKAPSSFGSKEEPQKKTRNGVLLIPQPSDDPRDPLVCLRRVVRLDWELTVFRTGRRRRRFGRS